MSSGKYRKRKRRVSHIGTFFFTFMLVILVFLVYLVATGKGTIAKTARRKAAETVVEKAVESSTGTKVDIEAEKSKMSSEDAQKVDDIIDKYGTNENVSKAVKAYQDSNGDTSKLKEELKGEIDPGDVSTMNELYEKYGTE